MTVAVKNNNKAPLVVPPAIRRKARFKTGQELEFRVSGGVITILPKPPCADDDYTPEQRRIIDARLKEALKEVEAGHTAGPFKNAQEMVSSLKRELRKPATRRTKPCSLDAG